MFRDSIFLYLSRRNKQSYWGYSMLWKQSDIRVDLVSMNGPRRDYGTYLKDYPNIKRKQKTSPSLINYVMSIESKLNTWKVTLAAMII